MKTSRINYLGDLRTQAEHLRSGNRITTDAPIDNQGKGEFFSPTDLLATSLGSCMLTIMGIQAKSHGFSIEGASAEITKVMGTDPRRVVEVVVEIKFPHNNYSPKERKLIESAAKECPVANSLHPSLVQTIKLNFGDGG